MTNKSTGAFFAVAAMAFLALGCLFAVLFPGAPLLWVAGGFVGYVACGRKAVIAWRLDDQVFDHPHRHLEREEPHRPMVAVALILGSLASIALTHGVLDRRG
jgi:hypothetical protein